MSTPRPHEIVVSIAHFEARHRFPLHKLFIWFIKTLWVQLTQLLLNSWRYVVAFVMVLRKNQLPIMPNIFKAHTKLSQHMRSISFAYFLYKNAKLTSHTLDTNRDWRSKWFFISPKCP